MPDLDDFRLFFKGFSCFDVNVLGFFVGFMFGIEVTGCKRKLYVIFVKSYFCVTYSKLDNRFKFEMGNCVFEI